MASRKPLSLTEFIVISVFGVGYIKMIDLYFPCASCRGEQKTDLETSDPNKTNLELIYPDADATQKQIQNLPENQAIEPKSNIIGSHHHHHHKDIPAAPISS